ncbi:MULTISPECIES: Lrp/AsnC family transcriptional regulator [unclassified Rhizobium]|uniref:Lrp/AsnC family transcriptional regulator n=1 Tax=unclassified Rhizobium TaxID=2613769 RepID=UPI0018CFBC34|nr:MULTISPECIES: Lrp/AsnC family transcriptional regulator [unclassified Rhizobium]MBN8953550.1 Lrp/AsnC family transcriptional regulator [Rhizobium tropici]
MGVRFAAMIATFVIVAPPQHQHGHYRPILAHIPIDLYWDYDEVSIIHAQIQKNGTCFMRTLDETDLKILRTLQKDGSLTVSEIAERVGISQSPCSRRIIQMQEDGVILGRTVALDARKLGFNTTVVARVKLRTHERSALEDFKLAVQKIPEVQMAVLMLGDFDYHLHVVVRDIDHYQSLLQDKLLSLPGVREMQSSVILETVKNTTALPL